MTEANDYGEPWHIAYVGNEPSLTPMRVSKNGFPVSYWAGTDDRIVECVNACAGIPSPAAALAEMREALRKAEAFILTEHDPTSAAEASVIFDIRSALAATEGSKPDTDDTKQVCQAGKDGECNWTGCPQKRDYKPWCPLAGEHDEDL